MSKGTRRVGRPPANRVCSIAGCDSKHRARGLCVTHYNREHGKRPKVTITCANCGEQARRDKYQARKYDKNYCSFQCRDDNQYREARARAAYEASPAGRQVELVHVGPPTYSHIPPSHPVHTDTTPSPGWFVTGPCKRCDEHFTVRVFNERGADYCSHSCYRMAGSARRRARKRGAHIEPVNRAKVFTRDGWRCHLCSRLVPARYRDPHIGRRYAGKKLPDLAPVIDHVIPLAEGGDHSMTNASCAHFACNSLKGAGVYGDGEQLRLA